jgi:hypothetical protein
LSGVPLTIAGGGVLTINGNVSLDNVLTNDGTVTMTGPASLAEYNNTSADLGKIYNLAGGLWDIQTNANIACEYCAGNEFFNNPRSFASRWGRAPPPSALSSPIPVRSMRWKEPSVSMGISSRLAVRLISA